MSVHLSRVRSLLLTALIAYPATRWGGRWIRRVDWSLGQLSRRRVIAFALVGFLAFGGSAAVGLLVQVPQPKFHDEFSYLLAADTFALGRLTNPTHPMWMHFESFHIIHQPTYASKYPPGQGLLLALGKAIGGHPIVGVWISVALGCVAVYWMLLAWVPPQWALIGGLLGVLRFGIVGYWSQSYWGGAVAMIGGALVFGALRRITRSPRVGPALLLALGLAILANSRPYEGLLISLPAGLVLLVWMLGKHGPPARDSIRLIIAPILVILVATAVAMGLYNFRVTGDPFRAPYQVHEATYVVAPTFLWQRLRPEPAYPHQVMREHWVNAHLGGSGGGVAFVKQQSVNGFLRVAVRKVRMLFRFYLGLVFTLPLLALPWVLRSPWMSLALLTTALLVFGLFAVAAYHAHYGAPMTALVLVLVVQGLRHLRRWRWRRHAIGCYVVWSVLLMAIAELGVGLARYAPTESSSWHLARARILADLNQDAGRHLVIVKYATRHRPSDEWVYNEADIDSAKVVWARELDSVRNGRLIEYFQDRRVWLLDADSKRPALVPFAGASAPRALRADDRYYKPKFPSPPRR